jgi:membrane associated rhomboid family serine protease
VTLQTRPSRLPAAADDPNRFGTLAFYASIGKAFVTMCAVVPILFVVEVLDQASDHRLDAAAGIRPLSLPGLSGIVLAPFLHVSFLHLYGNAIPLILTGTFVLAGGGWRFVKVTAFVALASGLGVWFLGSGVTVGASGVIFGYIGYLFIRGLVAGSWWNFAVALLIGGLYGWQVSGVIPSSDTNISWQAHLFGFIGGMLAAVLFGRPRQDRVRPAPAAAPVSPAV